MKKKFGALIALGCLGLLLLLLAGCGGGSKQTGGDGQASVQTLKLGSVQSTSGASASMGTEALRGLEYAVKYVNTQGGVTIAGKKYNLELVQYDDTSKADTAVSNMRKLIDQEKVKIIFGPPASTAALATLKSTETAKVINFATVAASPALTDGSAKYSFRNTPTAVEAQAAIVQAVKSMGLKNVAILARNDDWGKSGAVETKKNLETNGVKLVSEEYFAPGTKDFYSILSKIKGQNPDALAVMAIAEDGVPLVKQAKELGLNIPAFGAVMWNSPSFLEALGDAGKENIYAYSSAATSKNEKVKNFEQEFQKVTGQSSQTYDKNCFDAVMIVLEAMKAANTVEDTDKIAEALRQIQYDGILGHYSFKPNGQGRVQVNVNKMENGKPVPVIEIPGDKL
ncbi:MAG: ABC transporter substrate-binding protein [Eubacteriales bacterium]